ncbi:Phage repressor protein C, contains Cro/C1-type HTH and peptisase s24 domains [Tistlia consotensis]|uniref:Phage repressor protein C, contains Cro/C1-type HTH and peptisase s24 domains n=1 Tax=Tistlia consotensis USBA 355 TaxID=560819 RepID=A0A1Y6CX45_9PROT|nr:helix-turn-helix transcriptional regulator [Tistlia consotensis]SMF82839.1 Phage repressor protein C, contains Cro/C1-type HTH and peptisase s24 domains [Tistlia consotensis USBA 355]SNS31009.1 Phage repressor protein C, contains Cro/C1-type HTH and peptisase s24 domains [Tistlia consotensis]
MAETVTRDDEVSGSDTVSAANRFGVFSERLRDSLEGRSGTWLAKSIGAAPSTVNSWLKGESEPGLTYLVACANVLERNVAWLATGEGPSSPGESGAQPRAANPQDQFVGIPRYDVQLSAGGGGFAQRAELLDEIPFTPKFLRRKLGRGTTRDLVMVEVAGDSMEPTLSDGDLVMIDTSSRTVNDGLFALVWEDALLVKRLRRAVDGLLIISDNSDLYEPMLLPRSRGDEVQVVGRVRWVARVV